MDVTLVGILPVMVKIHRCEKWYRPRRYGWVVGVLSLVGFDFVVFG